MPHGKAQRYTLTRSVDERMGHARSVSVCVTAIAVTVDLVVSWLAPCRPGGSKEGDEGKRRPSRSLRAGLRFAFRVFS